MTSADFFLASLALLFIALKLTGVIAWPWLMVLAPIWGPVAVAMVTFGALWAYLRLRA